VLTFTFRAYPRIVAVCHSYKFARLARSKIVDKHIERKRERERERETGISMVLVFLCRIPDTRKVKQAIETTFNAHDANYRVITTVSTLSILLKSLII